MSIELHFVFDTNAMVNAMLFEQSVPAKAFFAALDLGDVLLSQATIAELRNVLSQNQIRSLSHRRGIFIGFNLMSRPSNDPDQRPTHHLARVVTRSRFPHHDIVPRSTIRASYRSAFTLCRGHALARSMARQSGPSSAFVSRGRDRPDLKPDHRRTRDGQPRDSLHAQPIRLPDAARPRCTGPGPRGGGHDYHPLGDREPKAGFRHHSRPLRQEARQSHYRSLHARSRLSIRPIRPPSPSRASPIRANYSHPLHALLVPSARPVSSNGTENWNKPAAEQFRCTADYGALPNPPAGDASAKPKENPNKTSKAAGTTTKHMRQDHHGPGLMPVDTASNPMKQIKAPKKITPTSSTANSATYYHNYTSPDCFR